LEGRTDDERGQALLAAREPVATRWWVRAGRAGGWRCGGGGVVRGGGGGGGCGWGGGGRRGHSRIHARRKTARANQKQLHKPQQTNKRHQQPRP
ncbi:hypothetical protein, partial [Shewanella sp. T24-MNA-CIBAN-0130]|uniref:hypothetical protein n=1 Tax=Shewanella sp. T24-MNA-CIBAN-0130 TaxID=3140470 RepID=UPI00331FF63B